MARLRCADCGTALTRECRWGGPGDHDPNAADRTPAVASGVMVWLPDADAPPAMRKCEPGVRRTGLPAPAVSINPSDALPGRLRSVGQDDGLERIYIGRRFRNDTERLEKLFELYTKMSAGQGASGKRRTAARA